MTGDDSCTELLAEPHRDADIAACLPDGSRVMLAVPPLTTHAAENGSACLRDCYAAAREQATPPDGMSLYWIRVKAGDGLKGWVSQEHLDHYK